jgi:hypothetical protein
VNSQRARAVSCVHAAIINQNEGATEASLKVLNSSSRSCASGPSTFSWYVARSPVAASPAQRSMSRLPDSRECLRWKMWQSFQQGGNLLCLLSRQLACQAGAMVFCSQRGHVPDTCSLSHRLQGDSCG